MLKAKVLAMCVCPVVAAPPAILAVHAPARHAVARVLHRAAQRLDPAPAPRAMPAVAAALPCAPSLVADGGALPVVGGALIGGSGDEDELALLTAGDASFSGGRGYGSGYGGGGYGGGGGGGGGYGGAHGGGGGTTPGNARPTGGIPIGPINPPTTGPAAPVSGAPEPTAWVFLVIGFGLVGAIARRRPNVADA